MTTKREFFDQKYFAKRYKFTYPSERLKDLVDFFWEMSPSVSESVPDEVNEKIFANISSSLIFNLGSPFYLYSGDNYNTLKESVFIGYRTLPAIYKHLRENNLFGIKFKPGALSVFFNISAQEMKNDFISFEELSHNSSITEQIAAAGNINDKILIAEEFLLKRLNEKNNFKYNTVKNTLNIYNSNLAASRKLNYISKEQNLIPKTIYRYFNDIIGLSPKICLNILRLRAAIKHYAFERNSFNVYDYGYFDYSHFIKEIKKYTQIIPAELPQ